MPNPPDPRRPQDPPKPDNLPSPDGDDDPPVEIPPPAPDRDNPAEPVPDEVPKSGREIHEGNLAQRRHSALVRLYLSSILTSPD